MKTDLADRVTRFLEVAEKATPGPWEDEFACIDEHYSVTGQKDVGVIGMFEYDLGGVVEKPDMDFILAARNDAPQLVRDLRAELARLEAERDRAENLLAFLGGLFGLADPGGEEGAIHRLRAERERAREEAIELKRLAFDVGEEDCRETAGPTADGKLLDCREQRQVEPLWCYVCRAKKLRPKKRPKASTPVQAAESAEEPT